MKEDKKNIYVTQPSLPQKEEFIKYIDEIWESRILTNSGPIHNQFEQALCKHLDIPHCSLLVNGTLSLIVALQALRITGEVITTPYSFVASSHSLLWDGITPVFCDIDPDTLTIDPKKIESLISPKTTAILPVHVYGTPCDIESLQNIADIYGLKIIYDAAHTFGVKYKGKSLCNYGDASILSFHATKIFHTCEGGAITTNDPELKKRIDNLKNFGFLDETVIAGYGINAKMSEIHAAMGLLMLKEYEYEIKAREIVAKRYDEALENIDGIRLYHVNNIENRNFAYYPIFINKKKYGISRDELYQKLKDNGIHTRRYFYPLISNMPAYQSLESAMPNKLPIANKIAEQVLCLPVYGKLESNDQDRIINIIRSSR